MADDRRAADALPFGVVHHLPRPHRQAFLRMAAQRAKWRGAVPTLEQVARGLGDRPAYRAPRDWDSLVWRYLGDPVWTRDDGTPDIQRIQAEEERQRREATAAREDWTTYNAIATAALELLAEITPPDGALTNLGVALMAADEETTRDTARERAASYAEARGNPPPRPAFLDDPTAVLTAEQRAEADAYVADAQRRDPVWWRRQLRRQAADARSYFDAALRVVGGRRGTPYVGTYTLSAWRDRQRLAAEHASRTRLRRVDRPDQTVSLADLKRGEADATVARVWCLTKCVGEWLRPKGWLPFFVTLTLPGAWHPNPKGGRRTWTPGYHPKAADAELQARWAALRTIWKDGGVDPVGFWTREPHGDGTPHQHGVLWVAPEQADDFARAIKAAFPGEHAAKVDPIEEGRAKAETYALFYVLKALNADPGDWIKEGDRPDAPDGDDGLRDHEEVRAWRSERRLRSFAFVGIHGIQGAWQTIATWRDEPPPDASTSMRDAWQAMQSKRWCDALLILLGEQADEEHAATGVRLAYEPRQTRHGRWRRAVVGLRDLDTGETVLRPRWESYDPDRDEEKATETGASTLIDTGPRDPSPPLWEGRPLPAGVAPELVRWAAREQERRQRDYMDMLQMVRQADTTRRAA